jgi:hypothetical protein
METATRNSRWNRKPVIRDDGKPAVARLTSNDIEIFKLLARYRYLSILDIHASIGGNLKHLSHRLSLLSREPNLFVHRPPRQREHANANYAPLVYELDGKGVTALSQYGIHVSKRAAPFSFVHELMACQVMHSIELGAHADKSVRLIEWREIYEKLPEKTKKLPTPTSIVVTYPGVRHKQVRADWTPFGVERSKGGKSFVFFAGIEVDCGTEPIDASDGERSSINAKFLSYAAIAEQRLYRDHFGFPNYFVPIITTTGVRMASMMRHLERLVAHGKINKREASIFIFKTFPSLTSYGPRQPVNGCMFSEPWKRVGEDFYFSK